MTLPQTSAAFLAALIERNRGLILEADQHQLSAATILVAGCGSTGGATVEPLVRAGVLQLLLAEPGRYELGNLNRQRATLQALDCNKAQWLAQQARAINPHVQAGVFLEGITEVNAKPLCQQADVVIDAVDVTTLEGLKAKFLLHQAAHAAKRPTICAYDLAYRQYVRIYDYRKSQEPFAGRLPQLQRAKTPMQALGLLVPASAIPYDLLDELKRLLANTGASISQLGCTADLFGALIVPLIIEILANRSIKTSLIVDLKNSVLPWHRRLSRRLVTIVGLMKLQQQARAGK